MTPGFRPCLTSVEMGRARGELNEGARSAGLLRACSAAAGAAERAARARLGAGAHGPQRQRGRPWSAQAPRLLRTRLGAAGGARLAPWRYSTTNSPAIDRE